MSSIAPGSPPTAEVSPSRSGATAATATHATSAAAPARTSARRRGTTGIARAASTPARTAARANGAIAPKPWPAPTSVASVCSKSPWPIRSAQKPASWLPSSGFAAVAASIIAAEGAASAIVVAGKRRYARASETARNGRIGIRKRAPGEPPPKGR